MFFTSYFSSENDPSTVNIVAYIMKSLFYPKVVKVQMKDKAILDIYFHHV